MNEETNSKLMDHDADGIRELDNNLPRWWVWLFILCVVWSVIYMIYFHVMDGPGQIDLYEAEMAAAGQAVPATAEPAAGGDEGAVAAAMDEASSDEAVLEAGKAIFAQNCAVCHAADGGGLIGPNMTDEYFIHGAAFADSIRIINEGVLAKGMIAWRGVLKPDQIYAVASYVYSLRGTTPATPKDPEGEKAQL